VNVQPAHITPPLPHVRPHRADDPATGRKLEKDPLFKIVPDLFQGLRQRRNRRIAMVRTLAPVSQLFGWFPEM